LAVITAIYAKNLRWPIRACADVLILANVNGPMSRRSRSRSILLSAYRVGVLIIVVLLLNNQARWFEAQRNSAISVRQARKFFPTANRLEPRERGLYFVTDARGATIGCLLTTSPETDDVIGYAGPNNLLVGLDMAGTVAGVELLRSGDTPQYVGWVKADKGFLRTFIGWKPAETAPPKPQAVSGATLTSFAIAEAIQKRLTGAAPSLRFPESITIEEVRSLFTNASHIVSERGRLKVLDAANRPLGCVMRTSPQTDNISGYRGPSECLVSLTLDGRTITGFRIRASYDTESYVEQVRRAQAFTNLFIGRAVEDLAGINWSTHRIEGVSGATQTARAAAEGVTRRFRAEQRLSASKAIWRPKLRDVGLVAVVGGAMVMSFTSLRRHRWLRLSWQVLLVAYVGLVNRDFVSLALLGGWASSGVAFKALPGLALLTAAAIIVPLTTRRQIYCHNICPHGAAQEILGRFRRWRWTPPPILARTLETVPGVLLVCVLAALLLGLPVNLASVEPFDAWLLRGTIGLTACIAIAGLAASLFVPQAYCRFGCPTGALLNFMRSGGNAARWSRRDSTALGSVALAIICVAGVRSWPRAEPEIEVLALHGKTMGTTWSMKIRDEVADPELLEKTIAREFEWAESLTSHWRANTDLSVFNRTRSTEPMPVPWPVITLARRAAEISAASGGAYDITVGALVRLWGFGPNANTNIPPSDSDIAAVQPGIGWQKLKIADGMIGKEHPGLEIDLSSIAEGWAIDHVALALERRGFTNFLLEVGGELRARGQWKIEIEHPRRSCTLSNESIATSGTYRQKHDVGSRRFSHLIDPRTGRPVAHNTVSVSVRHPECGQADPWATALNVLGVENGLSLAEKLKLAAEFVVEQSDQTLQVRQSSAWINLSSRNGKQRP
jgi:NosR/NirI family transcriptional regulator, nitrous oxide reductase regulator